MPDIKTLNKKYTFTYTSTIQQGGFLVVDRTKVGDVDTRSWFERLVDMFVKKTDKKQVTTQSNNTSLLQKKTLDEQLKAILAIPDEKYDDSMLSAELRKYITEREKEYISVLSDYKQHIAPSVRELKSSYCFVSGLFGKTYYASSYPSYVDFLWTRDLINFYGKRDMTWYIYPADDGEMQSVLKRRATQLRAEINSNASKGITIDTELQVEARDVEEIRQKLATRQERYFEGWFYATIYDTSEESMRESSKKFEQKIAGYGIRMKQGSQRMDEGNTSCLPLAIDDLGISRSMITTSLSGSFPFISNDLIENTGILYGVNLHTGSLVIFDRFSHKLPNANSVVLATSGAGKSFAVKLEILRYLLLGIEVIVIDPENEYKQLCEKVEWTYINIAINAPQFINPFDLPPKIEDVEYQAGDLLRSQIVSLIWLVSVLIWWLTPLEESLLDKALQATYAIKEITLDSDNIGNKMVPQMEDLLHILDGMEGWEELSLKISKYVSGTFGKLFNNQTNVNLDNKLTVFSIRDIEDALKTPAMYNVLNFIWTKVRSTKKKRLLVIDEAWIMLHHKASGEFLFQLTKRARKYGLGITTISQDVEDFINSDFGKPIVSNAACQLLLKQSTSSIKALEKAFGLSEAEQQKLVSSWIWEWVLMAGNQHVAVKILASPQEKDFITTDV